jgi:integrase/recombinase XerD
MTTLRTRMMEDMQVRNLSRHTQDSYLLQVSQFARHFAKSPDLLGPEDIRAYQVYLTNEKKLAPRSVHVTVAALRFLYRVTLCLDWDFDQVIPCPKAPKTLAVILSPEEVLHFLGCIENLKHQAILMTCYAAGLRVSEASRLKPEAIDRQRMVLRVEQGKGQKDRYVMLSARLLDVLMNYWRAVRPTGVWMLPGAVVGEPISTCAVEAACRQVHRISKLSKPVTPHSLRHYLPCLTMSSNADRDLRLLKNARIAAHQSPSHPT